MFVYITVQSFCFPTTAMQNYVLFSQKLFAKRLFANATYLCKYLQVQIVIFAITTKQWKDLGIIN